MRKVVLINLRGGRYRPGEEQPGGHVLYRLELGQGMIGFQLMDVDWSMNFTCTTAPTWQRLGLVSYYKERTLVVTR